MLQIERLDYIKQLLEANGSVSTSELIERLNVSKATVHRYLNRLQEERFAELTRGGAILAKKGGLYEQPYRVKRNQFTEEKSRIAHSASQMIRRNESIFLDSSSTVFEMTKYIGSYKDLLVATNDVLIASSLSEAEGITVSVIGGTLRKHFYTLTGPFP